MKFGDLPGISTFFADYADGEGPARAFFPLPPDASSLKQRAAAVAGIPMAWTGLGDLLVGQAQRFRAAQASLANIRKLMEGKAVAVMTTLAPALFGGPLSGWLKGCTALRLTSWLEAAGIPAVPVVWIHRDPGPQEWTVQRLSTMEPVRRRYDLDIGPEASIPEGIAGSLEEISSLLEIPVENSEVLQLLQDAYRPGMDPVTAWGTAISALLAPWGLILIDPLRPGIPESACGLPSIPEIESAADLGRRQITRLRDAGYDSESGVTGTIPSGLIERVVVSCPVLAQNLLFPVAAHVVGESDIFEFAKDRIALEALGMPAPLAWPRTSVTLGDIRSRKTMARYDLSLGDVFEGPEVLTARLSQEAVFEANRIRLEGWKKEMEDHIAALWALVPSEDRLARSVAHTRKRMTYQMEKLNRRFLESHRQRVQSTKRQIARLCACLAPWGRLQEREVSGFQFLLRHSSALPQKLAGFIDPFRFEHQLIFWD